MSSIRIQKDVNDKKKRSLIVLCIITCVCLVLCLIGYMSIDRTAPKLDFTYAVASVNYSDSNPLTASSFLKGVTASDAKDGDLTNKIKVSSMDYSNGGNTISINYFVRDNDGNIATAKRIYNLNGSVASVFEATVNDDTTEAATSMIMTTEAESTEITTEETTVDSSEETDEEQTDESSDEPSSDEPSVDDSTEAPIDTPTEEVTEAPTEPSVEETPEGDTVETPEATVDASVKPVLILTQEEVTLTVGSAFVATDYIAQLYDDVDDYFALHGTLWFENEELVNTSVPGEYEVIYHCNDSDRNFNDAPRLKIYII